jgi:enoyl-CoA hydratase
MTPKTYETIRVEIADHIATVTLDRPPANALNSLTRMEMIDAFDSLGDLGARVAILTGAGRIFCSGADLKDKKSGALGEPWAHNRAHRELLNGIKECVIPVIAAINGPALGAGFGIASSCDMMLASTTVLVGMPEINVGLMGGMKRLSLFYPPSIARVMGMTGRRIGADELLRLNIVDEVFEPEALMDGAMALAKTIAAKSPVAIRMAKHALNTVETMSYKDAYRFEQNLTVEASKTADAKEAQLAFAEKRKPVFIGR